MASTDNAREKLITIGKIADAHGLKGQVKVIFYGEDPSLLSHSSGIVVDGSDHRITMKVVKTTDKALICNIDGVSDRTQAESFRKKLLYLERSKLPNSMAPDEYYITDLVGLAVRGTDGEDYGTIKMVDNFGAGDLLSIRLNSGREFYLPFTKDTVENVDLKSGIVTIHPPDGYLE